MLGFIASTFEWSAILCDTVTALYSIVRPELGKATSWALTMPLSLLILLPVINAKEEKKGVAFSPTGNIIPEQ
jgi:hypothetical protein